MFSFVFLCFNWFFKMAKATRLRAPKVRYLKGQSDRAVNVNGCGERSAVSATPEN